MCAKNDAESLKIGVSQGFPHFLGTVPDILCQRRLARAARCAAVEEDNISEDPRRAVREPPRHPTKEDPQCLMAETTGWG
jgi:hypothetical protein